MKDNIIQQLKSSIRDIPDFPKKGVVFKDITPILSDGRLFRYSVEQLARSPYGKKIDAIVGIDARGFIFAGAVANYLEIGFVPIRKKGKLPFQTQSIAYDLEYGEGELEIHVDALENKKKVLIVDDLLATGGTALAATKLIEKIGSTVVGINFLVELEFLNGRKKLNSYPIFSIIQY